MTANGINYVFFIGVSKTRGGGGRGTTFRTHCPKAQDAASERRVSTLRP